MRSEKEAKTEISNLDADIEGILKTLDATWADWKNKGKPKKEYYLNVKIRELFDKLLYRKGAIKALLWLMKEKDQILDKYAP